MKQGSIGSENSGSQGESVPIDLSGTAEDDGIELLLQRRSKSFSPRSRLEGRYVLLVHFLFLLPRRILVSPSAKTSISIFDW